jgi:hypothetical protein
MPLPSKGALSPLHLSLTSFFPQADVPSYNMTPPTASPCFLPEPDLEAQAARPSSLPARYDYPDEDKPQRPSDSSQSHQIPGQL